MKQQVVSIPLPSISREKALQIGTFLAEVWQKPGKGPEYRANQLIDRGKAYMGPEDRAPHSLVIYDDDQVVAHTLIFERIIGTGLGQMSAMALGMVSSSPNHRGKGLGGTIVKEAFSHVDQGLFELSLFQTSHAVRPFYEKLGCCLVENPVINSLDGQHPHENPFKDEIVMRYPAEASWPEGEIDLLGEGY